MRCSECGNDNREGARFCDSCGSPLATAAGSASAHRQPAAIAMGEGPSAPEYEPLPVHAPERVGAGRFRLLGFLGEGTRKRVFVARDEARDGELVAVATFSTAGMAATAQARARREAEAMARLGEHPHLVAVLASGQDGSQPFIASEYMPGGDLGDLLDAAPRRRLGTERALSIAIDVAAALQHAHARGIIHRDIKPANIWLDSAGRARLGDFGLAAEARAQDAIERTLVGTAIYLPPEQAIGRRTDERADLYSLGALLYEMLVGEPPFPGDDPVSIISRHLSATPVPPSRHNEAVPRSLDELVGRLLAKSPDDRPAGARELLAELRRIEPDDEDAESRDDEDANPLDALAAGLFVGRDSEFGDLRELLESAIGGRGGVALIEGEPGIGKTRMLEELITYARIRGATVLSAACHEADGVPAYWPFAQAVRAYIRDADPVGLAWQLGADGRELARIVPELRDRVPSIEAPEPLGGEESRFRFFEAVTGFLVGIARSKPLVFAIDDLHWADSSSLELIGFLAHRLSEAPLLLISAFRPDEAERREAVGRALTELGEVTNHRRLALAGLDREAIATYLELSTGSRGSDELTEEIHQQTGGNPFFVGEVVRLIATEDGDEPVAGARREVPHGVRDAVSRRIERLPQAVTETLEVAAVAGREFSAELLSRVLGRAVDDELALARGARILERRRGEEGGHLFAHAVFREALYEQLKAARRLQLHERVGLALEELCGSDREPHLQALARQFANAGPAHREQALEYSLAAARQAAERLAHADAADYLERSLKLLPGDETDRAIDLRLELADEMTRCGRFHDARRVLWETVDLSRAADDTACLAQAGLSISALAEAGVFDGDVVTLIEEALERVDDEEIALRARLLAALSTQLYWNDAAIERRERAGGEAIELARRSGDDATLAEVLAIRQFLEGARPGMLRLRLENSLEMRAAASRAGDRNNEIRAIAYALVSYLQAGDMDSADRTLAEFAALAERLAEPRHLWHVPIFRATREIMAGNFERARELSEEGRRLGALAEEPLAAQFNAVQLLVLHTYEGRPEEMLPLVRRMVDAYPSIPAWRLALINFLTEADRFDEARAEYEPVAARGIGQLPRDANWLVGISRLGESAARLGDAEMCRAILGELEPFAGELVVIGRAAVSNGPVDRSLGMMAAAAGDAERGIAHLEQAIAITDRTGERPVRADTRLQLGRVLLERDQPGDRDRAFEVLSLALEEAGELGMRKLVERAVRLRLEAQGVAGVDAAASIDSVALAVADERPDLLSYASPDGRVTILFSDIENSTLMTERLGDSRWIEVLREHNSVFRRRLAERGGYEVKNQGDGFMLAFPDPIEALECALAVQRDLERQPAPDPERIRVRIGMHVGEVIEEEGDFFGRSVILAARIAAQARGGEVLVSEELQRVGRDSFAFDAGRELELKGLAGSHRAYRAEWESRGERAAAAEAASAPA